MGIDFELLHARLLAQVRIRVRNGELTERRLARLIGFSQPHTHNVLKGARSLTAEMGDLLLSRLNLSLLDLVHPEELAAAGRRRAARSGR